MVEANSKKFQRLVEDAIRVAMDSPMMSKHGALLIPRTGKYVLNSAYNTTERTCIRGSSYRSGLHAEVGCILGSNLRKKQFKRGLRATKGASFNDEEQNYWEKCGQKGKRWNKV